MPSTIFRLTAVTGTALFLAACASQPEPVVIQPAPMPMYTKDGMMIDQPQVMNQDTSCSNGMSREEDLEDGDIDCSN